MKENASAFSLQARISSVFVVVANRSQVLLALRIWHTTLETPGPCEKMQPQFLQWCHTHPLCPALDVAALLDTQSIIAMADLSLTEFRTAVFSWQFVHLGANTLGIESPSCHGTALKKKIIVVPGKHV